ncbi:CoA-binding protein [Pseudonocardia kunmingensis]|uniref:CoA-binding protein n=1 Tax=Pseudonocardia kunmingensis TaxID=630975 RepID=UPI00147893E4
MEASEFRGRVHLVNPRRREIGGRVCHPDVAALPEAPDVAVVCIPAARRPGRAAAVRGEGECGSRSC